MKEPLMERVKAAVDKDSSVIVHESQLNETEGFPLSKFEELGLSKQDMKTLVKYKIAIKAYIPTKQGWQNRYLLLARGDING